jgi:type IV pilus assembly protein PilB
MQASETGHLVLSTLHTNDSISTVNRLFNLGLAADLVAANLLVVIAQRLVRRMCPKCKIEYTPTAEEWRQVGIYSRHDADGIAYKSPGCSFCKQTGYYGQVGLYEMFVPNDRLREEIAKHPTKQSLKQLAVETGMQSMLEDGIQKIRQGITTINEVARVCYVEPENAGETKACPVCGTMMAEAETDCPICRQNIRETCQQCNARLEEDWKFCPFCGIPRPGQSAPESPIASTAPSPEVRERSDHKIRIVAADDEEPVRTMVKLLLETQGYQVIPAIDGEDALEKTRAELPDLIVLDIVMPKLDGFEVCKAIRAHVDTMFIPVVMLTGQNSIEEKQRGLSLGADDYITKPFHADELLARIEAVLRRSQRQQQ